MKKLSKVFLLSTLALSLLACTTDDATTPDPETPEVVEEETPTETETPDAEPEETDENEAEQEEVAEFDAQIEEMIEIEGMEEPIILNLYDNPDAIFLTYIPEDLIVEEVSGGEGESYKVFTNYVGVQRDDIYLDIIIFADHITEQPTPEDGDTTFALLVEDKEEVPAEHEWYDWTIQEYQSADGSSYVMLGEHNNQYFVMHIQSTPEFSEGFIPRVHKVIEHFYWKDTNEYLVQKQ